MEEYSASPVSDLYRLDEDGVAQFFASLGFPWYDAQLKEHGITGEILIYLDHEGLKDVGIHSVGQRLTILKAVYELKVAQNIPVEVGHYVPPSEDLGDNFFDSPATFMPPQQILGLLHERDDRIRNLEMEVQRLHDSLVAMRDESQRGNSKTTRPAVRSPITALFPHPLSNQSTLSRNNSISNKSRAADPFSNGLPDSPRSPGYEIPGLPPLDFDTEPAASSRTAPSYSIHPASGDYSSSTPSYSSGAPPLFTSTVLTPTTPTGPVSNDPSLPSTSANLSATVAQSNGGGAGSAVSSGAAKTGTSERTDKPSNSDNPYRSFRVTLEDPCYKVLPAALKKYKINDDWRQYALFICYGNTERCLAYDEKPLMLFQRLKENNANPVFMLRNIKDIKSPITVASAKHAMRRDRRPANAGTGLDRPPIMDHQGAAIARPTRLHHPPVLLPVGKDRDREKADYDEKDDLEGDKPPPSPSDPAGYCISIYPYLAEREDEFDVAVGDTFVIISKTKGWWVVYRDLGPHGVSDTATRKSAWVPAGCLLETSVPPLTLPGAGIPRQGFSPYNASAIPIEPAYLVSISTLGIALMDYSRNGSDELDVKKDDQLRILKRYNHWSYAIKNDGQRGWIPSWFCGRAPREGTPTTPTIATVPTTRLPIERNGSVPSVRPSVLDEDPHAPNPNDVRVALSPDA